MASSESTLIRSAMTEDAGVVLSLIDALADYEKLARPNAAARDRLVVDLFSDERKLECALAFVAGRAAGYAMTFRTYSSFLALPKLYLEDLFVLEEYRGLGVGHALFEHARNEAIRTGCAKLQWTVLDWNQPAIDFYIRQGAKPLKQWLWYELDLRDL